MRKKEHFPLILAVAAASLSLVFVAAFAARGAAPQKAASSRAYAGHANDIDIANFVRAYPKAAGTRLDDCQTCHRGGPKGTDAEREFSPCGYCHLLEYPNPRYKTGVPADYEGTLNAYGLAYENAGRTVEALAAIAKLDSDGDGFANEAEIAALRYPGDPTSRPGQPLAPFVSLSLDALRKLPVVRQFMLMNTTKEPTDDYTTYTGVKVADLLAAARVDLRGVEGITVFAPDGYSIDCSIDDITKPFPKGYYYAGPAAAAGADRAFVKSPEVLPSGVADGKEIPGAPWLILAFERDGASARPLGLRKGDRAAGRRGAVPAGQAPARPHGRPGQAGAARPVDEGQDLRRRLGLQPEDRPQRRGVRPRRLRHPGQPGAGRLRGVRLEERLAAHLGGPGRRLRPRRPLEKGETWSNLHSATCPRSWPVQRRSGRMKI